MELQKSIFERYKFLCLFTAVFFSTTIFLICFIYSRPFILYYTVGRIPKENPTYLVFSQRFDEKWVIDSLRPINTTNLVGNSTYCDGAFDMEELKNSTVYQDLLKYWPNPGNQFGVFNLWADHWEKYGACIENMTSTDYFTYAVDLYKQYKVQDILYQVPKVNGTYLLSDIRKKFDFRPVISCQNETLDEIHFCFDKDLNSTHCPRHFAREHGCNLTSVDYQASIDFDILVLSQNWLPTVNTTQWSIHGLWPSYESGTTGPSECTDVEFDYDILEPLWEKLYLYWPTKNSGNITEQSIKFWEHEWTKHGSCSLQLDQFNNIVDYFNKTLVLYQQIDVFGALAANNILPNDSLKVPVEKIQEAIYDAFNVNSIIASSNDKLTEIRQCFNLDLEPINCTVSDSHTSTIYPTK